MQAARQVRFRLREAHLQLNVLNALLVHTQRIKLLASCAPLERMVPRLGSLVQLVVELFHVLLVSTPFLELHPTLSQIRLSALTAQLEHLQLMIANQAMIVKNAQLVHSHQHLDLRARTALLEAILQLVQFRA